MLKVVAPVGQAAPTLTADQQTALVEYLRGL